MYCIYIFIYIYIYIFLEGEEGCSDSTEHFIFVYLKELVKTQ